MDFINGKYVNRGSYGMGYGPDPDEFEDPVEAAGPGPGNFGADPQRHRQGEGKRHKRGPLIALVGYKGTGKSTLLKKIAPLQNSKGHVTDEIAFAPTGLPIAGPLKDAIRALAGRPNWDLDDPKVKGGPAHPSPVPVRNFLEAVGNGIRRLDPDYFIRRWLERYEEASPWWPTVVDDVNFPNEVSLLKAHGALVVYVSRMAVIRKSPWLSYEGGPPLESDLGVRTIIETPDLIDYRLRLDEPEDVECFMQQLIKWFEGGPRPSMDARPTDILPAE